MTSKLPAGQPVETDGAEGHAIIEAVSAVLALSPTPTFSSRPPVVAQPTVIQGNRQTKNLYFTCTVRSFVIREPARSLCARLGGGLLEEEMPWGMSHLFCSSAIVGPRDPELETKISRRRDVFRGRSDPHVPPPIARPDSRRLAAFRSRREHRSDRWITLGVPRRI